MAAQPTGIGRCHSKAPILTANLTLPVVASLFVNKPEVPHDLNGNVHHH
jgi:hypothetical protein